MPRPSQDAQPPTHPVISPVLRTWLSGSPAAQLLARKRTHPTGGRNYALSRLRQTAGRSSTTSTLETAAFSFRSSPTSRFPHHPYPRQRRVYSQFHPGVSIPGDKSHSILLLLLESRMRCLRLFTVAVERLALQISNISFIAILL